ncbi:MAG: hypothetical protein HQL39_19350, partial [Alphaproteobacteria bacterium]|nr:hypothetical protein [Alphaproteobacteria bacterium]
MARAPRSPEADAILALRDGLDALGAVAPTLGPARAAKTRACLDDVALAVARLRATMPKAPQAAANVMRELLDLISHAAPTLNTSESS